MRDNYYELLPELPEDVPDLKGMKPRQKGRGFLILEEDISFICIIISDFGDRFH